MPIIGPGGTWDEGHEAQPAHPVLASLSGQLKMTPE